MLNFLLSVQWRSILREIFMMVLIIGSIQFLLPRSVVKGHSMEPNLEEGQRLAASPIPYIFGEPQRGDIVMLYPVEEGGSNLVKRIIGLPNELIQFQDGQLFVNGRLSEEDYLVNICVSCRDGEWLLGENEYFVVGDNRATSYDSRNYGAIQSESIMAKVLFRWYPLTELRVFVD